MPASFRFRLPALGPSVWHFLRFPKFKGRFSKLMGRFRGLGFLIVLWASGFRFEVYFWICFYVGFPFHLEAIRFRQEAEIPAVAWLNAVSGVAKAGRNQGQREKIRSLGGGRRGRLSLLMI